MIETINIHHAMEENIMRYVSCTPVIDYGIYVEAIYKTWEGKKQTFEGKIRLDSTCRIKKKYQDKYPGSFREGIISSIRENGYGAAEFWVCFRAEIKGLFYASYVPYDHIDWEDYLFTGKKFFN